ncbi:EpsG-like putative glucosyltransferase [Aquimarina sp. MAR_2010_214]|uniref:EpsG family protein n=1 Tax=Aquimarina sp. MAR_2010_214 TaxID=1250026 RepID=UPI000C70A8BA|nr:EpsG family protein [Aquimarina sp. MAR_2010_214]PKV50982.1 EpsG-like putative glucosyltransferase [Aquimarina sp. MAR_2010_214]
MFDFVPAQSYYSFYINISFGIVLFTLMHAFVLPITDKKNISYINWIGYVYLLFIILYVGLRPVEGGVFGDMGTYKRYFVNYANGATVMIEKDALFHHFMKVCSYVMSSEFFFLTCMFLYTFPLYRISKVFFKEYWFYCFLMLAVSFSFWTYGTNGIRNGMATSFFLYGLSFINRNKLLMVLFILLGSAIHQTMLLPAFAFSITYFYSKPKLYLIGWLLAIPLSIVLGGFWESLFASLGFADDRLEGYLTGDPSEYSFSSTGFRYDFLLYSAAAVFVGWYFIFKRNFEDKIYINIYNTYLICNAFWILVIRASFSNRFAYLSWFMMGLVIIYPYLKKEFFSKHHIVVGKVLTAYFLFTYLMYYIYYGG